MAGSVRMMGGPEFDETETFGIDVLSRVLDDTTALLADRRDDLNAMNVFPVADADTGTNMAATMTAMAGAVTGREPVEEYRATLTRAGLVAARGNSGLILSQFITGFVSEATSEIDGSALARCLGTAAARARAAVADPVEGTMITVADAAASAAVSIVDAAVSPAFGSSQDRPAPVLTSVAQSACDAALEAVLATPDQLPVLAAAGVCDAGAAGLAQFYLALFAQVDGGTDVKARSRASLAPRSSTGTGRAAGSVVGHEYTFIVDGDARTAVQLRELLGRFGTDVVVGDGGGLLKAHVHVGSDRSGVDAMVRAVESSVGSVRDVRSEPLTVV